MVRCLLWGSNSSGSLLYVEYLQSIIIYLCTVSPVLYRLQSAFLYGVMGPGWAFVGDCIVSLNPRLCMGHGSSFECAGLVVEQDSAQLQASLVAGYCQELGGRFTLRCLPQDPWDKSVFSDKARAGGIHPRAFFCPPPHCLS